MNWPPSKKKKQRKKLEESEIQINNVFDPLIGYKISSNQSPSFLVKTTDWGISRVLMHSRDLFWSSFDFEFLSRVVLLTTKFRLMGGQVHVRRPAWRILSALKKFFVEILDIFQNTLFFYESLVKIENQTVLLKKQSKDDNENYILEVLFEKNPYILRKIMLDYDDFNIFLSLSNHNYNNILEKKFFSMANPFLKN